MTLSELIEKLSKYEKEHGDRLVMCGGAEVEDIEIEIMEGDVVLTLNLHDHLMGHKLDL